MPYLCQHPHPPRSPCSPRPQLCPQCFPWHKNRPTQSALKMPKLLQSQDLCTCVSLTWCTLSLVFKAPLTLQFSLTNITSIRLFLSSTQPQSGHITFSSVQSLSHVRLCDPMNRSMPGPPVHHQLPEFTQTHVHRVSDAIQPLILCRPLLLLPPIPLSFRVFSNESTLPMRWPKYWSFSFSICPSNEHPGLIFRMDWLDLLAVQGTLKSLLQHHSSEASIILCSAFFTV